MSEKKKTTLEVDREELETLFAGLFDATGQLSGKQRALAKRLLEAAERAGWDLGSKSSE